MKEIESFEARRAEFIESKTLKIKKALESLELDNIERDGIPQEEVTLELLYDIASFLMAIHRDGSFLDRELVEIDTDDTLEEKGLRFNENGVIEGMRQGTPTWVEFSGNDKYGVIFGIKDDEDRYVEDYDAAMSKMYILLFNRYAQNSDWLKKLPKK